MLILELSDGTNFKVELVNEQWNRDWAKQISTMELLPTVQCKLGGYHNDLLSYENNLNILYNNLQNIPDIFNCDIPKCFPDRGSYNITDNYHSQQYLNLIHRWCTYIMMGLPFVLDGIDITSKYKLATTDPELNAAKEYLLSLTRQVHAVEKCFDSIDAKSWPGKTYNKVFWDQGFVGDDPGYILRKDADVEDLFDVRNYDVYLARRMLGKDFRECWVSVDDVKCVDITNTGEWLHYAFEVDPLNDWHSFYNSDECIGWLIHNGRGFSRQDIGRIPIGNIINKHEHVDIEQTLLHTHIVKIRYIE